MRRTLAGIIVLSLILTLGACGKTNPNAAKADERTAANITSGAAKVAQNGDYIYMSRGDRIVRFNPDQITEKDTLDDFTFKTGNYSDICIFADKLYAIESVSEERSELIAIDLQSGNEQVIKVFKDDEAKNLWFNNLIGDKLYLWVNESIFYLDVNNEIKDTGYRNPLFVTEDGVYVSASVVDDVNKGLSFVSNGSVVEYKDLKEKKVDIKFKYGSRIYMTVDNSPAYIEHNGSQEVTYIKISSGVSNLSDAFVVCMNYVDSPEKTLVLSVGTIDPNATDYSNSMFSRTYTLDVETGIATQIYEKTHIVVPLCWPSVIGEDIFVGGIGDSTDWITAEKHLR